MQGWGMPPKYQKLADNDTVYPKGSSCAPIPLGSLSVWDSRPIRLTYVFALVLSYVYTVLPVLYKIAVVFSLGTPAFLTTQTGHDHLVGVVSVCGLLYIVSPFYHIFVTRHIAYWACHETTLPVL